jgi:hypothetical protein
MTHECLDSVKATCDVEFPSKTDDVPDHDQSLSDLPVSTEGADREHHDCDTIVYRGKKKKQRMPSKVGRNALYKNGQFNARATVKGASPADEVMNLDSISSNQRRFFKGAQPEEGNRSDDGFVCVGQASGMAPLLTTAFTRIDSGQQISRCRSRMFDELQRPASTNGGKHQGGPKTGALRIQSFYASPKRRKICDPKTGIASSCRGSLAVSISCSKGPSPCDGPVSFCSESLLSSHNENHCFPIVAPRGGAEFSVLSNAVKGNHMFTSTFVVAASNNDVAVPDAPT